MEQDTKKKIGTVVTAAAAGIALAVMVGQITPINLIHVASSDSSIYSGEKLFGAEECCGPYHQCQCPSFKWAS